MGAHPSTPLFLLAAVAFAAPDVLATPVQGLRGAISNSTGKARPVAQANLSAPGDDVESGGGKTCCKNEDDETTCYIEWNLPDIKIRGRARARNLQGRVRKI